MSPFEPKGAEGAEMATNGTADPSSRATENRTMVLYCIVGTIVPTTVIMVATRIYTRKVIVNAVGADDWVCLISMVSSPGASWLS